MTNNDDIGRNEKLFEAMLKIAAEEAMKEEAELLPSQDELNKMYPPTDTLNRRVHGIINRARRIEKRKVMLRNFGKVAAVFGILFTLSTAILMTVEASRNFILNTFINIQDDYVAFEFGIETQDKSAYGFVLGYMPEGFELLNRQSVGGISFEFFANAIGEEILIQQNLASDVTVAIDNEVREFSNITIGEHELFIFESFDPQDQNVVMLQVGNDVFSIFSHLGIDELKLIASAIGQ